VSIVKSFEAIGAKARVTPSTAHGVRRDGFTINITHEKGDEVFDIRHDPNVDFDIEVVDKRPKERHLLLMVKQEERKGAPTKQKFLCGHDEMHWFVAPVNSAVADVPRAKESLKPPEVVAAQSGTRRKNKKKVRGGIIRQGEWFFIPKPTMKAPANQILRNEPIRREGGGKPHIVEEVWRKGGDAVYESTGGMVLDPMKYRKLQRENPKLAQNYRAARVNAEVFGRGKVRHPDHSTVELGHWYQIVPNTEHKFATRSMRFVD